MAEDPGAIREEIAETREQLADTISKLGEKADVKAQATAKVDSLKAAASEVAAKVEEHVPEQARPAVHSATTAVQRDPKRSAKIAAGVLLALVVLRRLRRRSSTEG